MKPTLQVPHGGGRRLDPAGADYRALLQWIRQGAPYGNGGPEIVRLEVMPRQIVLEPKLSQQLVVTAWLSDGSREDFTRRVHYQSTAEEVVEVDEDGLVRAREPGEATVLVQAPRLAARVSLGVVSRILEKFPRETPRNFIDEEVWRKLRPPQHPALGTLQRPGVPEASVPGPDGNPAPSTTGAGVPGEPRPAQAGPLDHHPPQLSGVPRLLDLPPGRSVPGLP